MRKRRIDPTLIALSLISLITIGVVATFIIFTSIVAQDDARIYPTSPSTATPFYSSYYPAPIPTSPSEVLGPALDPRPAAVSQTIDGITIVVQPRYADLQTIVFTYTISGPTQPYPYTVGLDPSQYHWPALTLDDGTPLPSQDLNPYEHHFTTWLSTPSGEIVPNEGILTYDASRLPSFPTSLNLHLSMPIFVNNSPSMPQTPIPTVVPGVYATATPLATNTPLPFNKSLNFEFKLATQTDNRCRQLQPNISIEKAGIKMTLDNISITATEARINLSFSGTFNGTSINSVAPSNPNTNYHLTGTMDTGPGTLQFPLQENCFTAPCYRFTGFHYKAKSLLDAPQPQWLLKIDSLYDDQGSISLQVPWIFKFDMPAASPCTSVPTPIGTAIPTVSPLPTP